MVERFHFWSFVALEFIERVELRLGPVGQDHDAQLAYNDRACTGEIIFSGHWDEVAGGALGAVAPRSVDGFFGGVFCAGEGEAGYLPGGEGLFVGLRDFGADALAMAQLKCGEYGVEDVAGEVSHYSGAEFSPASPSSGMVDILLIWAHRGDADPLVPVEIWGDGILAFGPSAARVAGALPRVPLLDLADCSILDDADGHAVRYVGVNLDSHLRYDVGLARGQGQLPRLIDGVRQGLLAIDVLAETNGGHRYGGVHVVWRADVDGIDLVGFPFEQLSPVAVLAGVREFLGRLCEAVGINVADCDDIGRPAV